MKKKLKLFATITIILIFVLIIWFIIDTGIRRQIPGYGVYMPAINKIVCTTRSSCIHEIGHKIDDENDWISKEFEWRYAVHWYRVEKYYYPETRDAMSSRIMFFEGVGWDRIHQKNPFYETFWRGGWGGYTELYAEILEMADGNKDNMPEIFMDFYDWDRIDELMAIYDQ